MIGTILNFLGGSAVKNITNRIAQAYEMKLRAETDEKKLEAEITISQLQAQQNVLLAEQGRWFTAWIRPLLALPVVIMVWKIIVYDTVLGLGVTPDPGSLVQWIMVTIIGAYFLTRPFEKIFARRK